MSGWLITRERAILRLERLGVGVREWGQSFCTVPSGLLRLTSSWNFYQSPQTFCGAPLSGIGWIRFEVANCNIAKLRRVCLFVCLTCTVQTRVYHQVNTKCHNLHASIVWLIPCYHLQHSEAPTQLSLLAGRFHTQVSLISTRAFTWLPEFWSLVWPELRLSLVYWFRLLWPTSATKRRILLLWQKPCSFLEVGHWNECI